MRAKHISKGDEIHFKGKGDYFVISRKIIGTHKVSGQRIEFVLEKCGQTSISKRQKRVEVEENALLSSIGVSLPNEK